LRQHFVFGHQFSWQAGAKGSANIEARGCEMRAAPLSALLMLSVATGCSQRQPVSAAVVQPQPPPAIQRTLIEAPPPAAIPEPPLPALKPGTELGLAESEALVDQASPKAPPETQVTASQRAIGRVAGRAASLPAAAGAEAPPLTDAAQLVSLSQTDATKLFGPPAERKNLPPSQIWTYHSAVCELKLFFYPEVGGPTFRALTYQIDERGAFDASHNTCLSSLIKLPTG
jgi:hypothetical protein